MTTRSVAVIGGGISGLSAAYRLLADHPGKFNLTLYEARERLGGNIHTEMRDGFLLDAGPDSFVAMKREATELCKELGLGAELMETTEANRKVYIFRNNQLHPLPEGMVLAVPTRAGPFLRTPLFSWGCKLRMGLEPLVGRSELEDESIGSFIERRLGKEMLDVLAEPLLGGIFAGDVRELSIRSTFPQLVEMERKFGSLVRGAMASRKHTSPSRKPPSAFLSLRSGMGRLVDALRAGIESHGGRVVCNMPIGAVRRERTKFLLEAKDRDAVLVDDLVIAAPAHAAARMLGSDVGAKLAEVSYLSTATIFLGARRQDVRHPLDAVGIVIPKGQRRVMAVTFVSSKWEDRAPADRVLLRVFVGGHRDPDALTKSDDELAQIAIQELRDLVGLQGPGLFQRVFRFERANPQPHVGHAARLRQLQADLDAIPGLHVLGAGMSGVGIPDCVRQAVDLSLALATSAGPE